MLALRNFGILNNLIFRLWNLIIQGGLGTHTGCFLWPNICEPHERGPKQTLNLQWSQAHSGWAMYLTAVQAVKGRAGSGSEDRNLWSMCWFPSSSSPRPQTSSFFYSFLLDKTLPLPTRSPTFTPRGLPTPKKFLFLFWQACLERLRDRGERIQWPFPGQPTS